MIEVKELNFSYGISGAEKSFSFDSLNFSISAGEFVGIFGPNGSGKSTILKLLTGYLKAKSGSIKINNQLIGEYNLRTLAKLIAFVPQTVSTAYPYSVYDIVSMGRSPHLGLMGFIKDEDHRKIMECLDLLSLTHIMKKGLGEISGGEAQRALIARALAQETEIIMLDEPNSHLDIKHQIHIFDILKNFNEEKNKTIVAVSHDLNLSANYCKKGILLDRGKIVCYDQLENVLTEENIFKVFGIQAKIIANSNPDAFNVVIKP